MLDPAKLTDDELVQTYAEQHSVERGFAFLKDPLFLASSVFVIKPERIVALSLVHNHAVLSGIVRCGSWEQSK